MKPQSKKSTGSQGTNLTILIRIAAFFAIIALISIPLFSSSLASSPSRNSEVLASTQLVRGRLAAVRSDEVLGKLGNGVKQPLLLPFLLPPSETIEIFAADCTTPKSAFALGETVCAVTDGVDLVTVPGNYYMNWIDSSLNQTNGGTITQNPQNFLFVPPTADTWKATIGRVSPADSSIVGNPPIFTVSSNSPGVSTFTTDCSTPKTTFTLGQQVCATAAATGGAASRRRVVWIDPSGNARQVDSITADPESFFQYSTYSDIR
jgi:Tfp pilus assembly protein FimT